MVVVELFVRALVYPLTALALQLMRYAALRGDVSGAGRWLRLWECFHAPVDFVAALADYSVRRRPSAFERYLSFALWRYVWYREFIAYCVGNGFPFSQRPWPSFIRNGTPFYAVEYYWQLYVACDWSSAQDSLRDANYCGWSIDVFRVERRQWEERL